jgi:hypothetical protein
MTTKSTFSALGANVTGLGAGEPRVEGLALPKSVECGNLNFSKTGIRWISGKARFAFAEALILSKMRHDANPLGRGSGRTTL